MTTLPYNLTNITDTNSTLVMFQNINVLSNYTLGNMWSIVFFIIIFMLGLQLTKDVRKAMLASGAINFILSGILFIAAGLLKTSYGITYYLPLAYAIFMVLGIILLQDKDTSG